MKLYVWENVLWDYKPGIAFCLANSLEEAVDLMTKKLDWSTVEWEGNKLEGKEAIVIEEPTAFYQWGGM